MLFALRRAGGCASEVESTDFVYFVCFVQFVDRFLTQILPNPPKVEDKLRQLP